MKMNKIIGVAMSAIILVSAMSGCGSNGSSQTPQADKSLKEVQDKGYFVMGLDDTFLPMGYRDEKNEVVGFDIDIAKAVAKELKVELKIQPIAWAANEQELNTKNIDCVWNGMSVNETRKKSMNLSSSYMKNKMVLTVRKGDEATELSGFDGKTVAVQSGSPAADAVKAMAEKNGIKVKIVEFADNNSAMMDLEISGCDAVCTDSVFADYYISQTKKAFVVMKSELSEEEYAIGFRKNDVELTNAVNGALKSLKEKGELKKISEKWFGVDVTII